MDLGHYLLLGVLITLFIYMVVLQFQIKRLNSQLMKRLEENTRQPLSLELLNKELNLLACNINKSLKKEEKLRLNSLNEEKHFKELIANISHDIRTPLTAVKGCLQLFDRKELTHNQIEKLNICQKHTANLEQLVGQFFEYSYLLHAAETPEITKVNLSNLVAECLADSYALFEERQIGVHITDHTPVIIYSDKRLLLRIIQNLIRNCIRHADGNLEITILQKENTELIFRNYVEHPESINTARLFDRFYTADTSRNKSTGLGLSIVKLLTEQLEGCVSAKVEDSIFEIKIGLP